MGIMFDYSSAFPALNPDKWIEFKLQEKAQVSHNTLLFRLDIIFKIFENLKATCILL